MSAKSDAINKKVKNFQEQTQKAAMSMLNKLVSQFYDVFMENDPDSEAVSTIRKQVIAKWKMYCIQKNLVKEVALPMCEEAIKSIVDKYNEQLAEV